MSTSTINMPKAEWLEARRQGIGGSDIATICGLNKYCSPYQLWLDRTNQVHLPDVTSERAEIGSDLEDYVARKFSERTGFKVTRRNAILQHPQYPFMLANIDRYVYDPAYGERGVLECKTSDAWGGEKWWEGEDIPISYMLQIQHYLGVTGCKYGYLACLQGLKQHVYRAVIRDGDLIDMITDNCCKFWGMVQNMTPPEIDGSESATELLKTMYPPKEGEIEEKPSIAIPIENLTWIEQREKAKAEEKQAKADIALAENHIKQLLGNAETAICGDRKITWKTVHKDAYTVAASSYRQLSVK